MVLETLISELRTHIPEGEICLRLTLATFFGSIIGIDRELRDHPAGLRTHMLTSAAAALFTILTLELYHEVRSHGGDPATADPLRIVEAVTSGVAFLAAGAIIHGQGTVRGLTTGAGMWLAGAIGVACGSGRYSIALIGAVLALVILSLVHILEIRLRGNLKQQPEPGQDASSPSRTRTAAADRPVAPGRGS
jgi:putative Mg2+ transporter-C (MgtC) family protein